MTHGFIANNIKKKLALLPTEDSLSIDSKNKIFVVADGVTRDPLVYLPDLNTLQGKVKFSWNYPRLSPAKIAADIFTQTFPSVLREYNDYNRDENAIRAAFKEANKKIGAWNQENIPTPDYVLNDFAGCVAAAALEECGLVRFGFLTDCGVAIFDEKANLKFRTENQGPDKHDKYIWEDERLKNLDWKNPQARKIIRSEYRNNPSQKNSFGVLTGEATAMQYVRTMTQEIAWNEHLIVYTDGLEEIIFSNEFANTLYNDARKGIEKLCKKKVRTEGTLIHYQKPGPPSSNWNRMYESYGKDMGYA